METDAFSQDPFETPVSRAKRLAALTGKDPGFVVNHAEAAGAASFLTGLLASWPMFRYGLYKKSPAVYGSGIASILLGLAIPDILVHRRVNRLLKEYRQQRGGEILEFPSVDSLAAARLEKAAEAGLEEMGDASRRFSTELPKTVPGLSVSGMASDVQPSGPSAKAGVYPETMTDPVERGMWDYVVGMTKKNPTVRDMLKNYWGEDFEDVLKRSREYRKRVQVLPNWLRLRPWAEISEEQLNKPIQWRVQQNPEGPEDPTMGAYSPSTNAIFLYPDSMSAYFRGASMGKPLGALYVNTLLKPNVARDVTETMAHETEHQMQGEPWSAGAVSVDPEGHRFLPLPGYPIFNSIPLLPRTIEPYYRYLSIPVEAEVRSRAFRRFAEKYMTNPETGELYRINDPETAEKAFQQLVGAVQRWNDNPVKYQIQSVRKIPEYPNLGKLTDQLGSDALKYALLFRHFPSLKKFFFTRMPGLVQTSPRLQRLAAGAS